MICLFGSTCARRVATRRFRSALPSVKLAPIWRASSSSSKCATSPSSKGAATESGRYQKCGSGARSSTATRSAARSLQGERGFESGDSSSGNEDSVFAVGVHRSLPCSRRRVVAARKKRIPLSVDLVLDLADEPLVPWPEEVREPLLRAEPLLDGQPARRLVGQPVVDRRRPRRAARSSVSTAASITLPRELRLVAPADGAVREDVEERRARPRRPRARP